MNLNGLFKKYHNTSIEDCGTYNSKEFNQFCKDAKSTFKNECKSIKANLVKFGKWHYDFSAFVERNGKYVYISYRVPRGEMTFDLTADDPMDGWLIRKAGSPTDYTGGRNNFSNTLQLFNNIDKLLG